MSLKNFFEKSFEMGLTKFYFSAIIDTSKGNKKGEK